MQRPYETPPFGCLDSRRGVGRGAARYALAPPAHIINQTIFCTDAYRVRPYIIDNHDDVSAFLIILYSLVARIAVRVGSLVARTGRPPLGPRTGRAPLAPDAFLCVTLNPALRRLGIAQCAQHSRLPPKRQGSLPREYHAKNPRALNGASSSPYPSLTPAPQYRL